VIEHTTVQVPSGDVKLFCRRVGKPGGVPVLILHGGNYYDSLDWLPVAARIADGREVLVFDQRGMGNSTWSPSKNYSNDAVLGDVLAVMDYVGWERAVIFGHSRNSVRGILLGAHFPERTAGIILADSLPGSGPPPGVGDKPGAGPTVYPTVDALIAKLSNDKSAAPGSAARMRLESLAKPVEGGFIVGPRDPDMENTDPIGQPNWSPKYRGADLWAELRSVKAPVMLLRAMKSASCKPPSLERLTREFHHVLVVEIDSGHDLAACAPEGTASAVLRFVRSIEG
jgi:pimeloyl-ACP methyl ester carboxylesterase